MAMSNRGLNNPYIVKIRLKVDGQWTTVSLDPVLVTAIKFVGERQGKTWKEFVADVWQNGPEDEPGVSSEKRSASRWLSAKLIRELVAAAGVDMAQFDRELVALEDRPRG